MTTTTVGAGQPVTQTFGGLDVIDGGAGTADSMVLTNDVGTMNLATSVTVSNIEGLTLRSAQKDITADVQGWTGLQTVTVDQRGAADNVRLTTKANVTGVTITAGASLAAHDSDGGGTDDAADSVITIADNGSATTDKLASVSVTGARGAINIASDALTSLTLASSAKEAVVTNNTTAHTLNVTVNAQAVGAKVTDAAAKVVNVTASGATSTSFEVNAELAEQINFAGDKTLTALLTTQKADLAITSSGSGSLTISTTLDNDVSFTGGAGKETITVTNANAKAIAMGAGDDKVNVSGTSPNYDGTIDGGDGVDTLSLSAADAASLSANGNYETRISGFEKVELGIVNTATSSTVNLANLDDIGYVISKGTAAGEGAAEVATVTFTGLLSGQSVTVTDGTKTQTVTAPADMTASQVATAFNTGFVAGTLDDSYTVTVSGGVATLTAKTVGNKTDVGSSVANSTLAQLTAATTSTGVATVTGVAEVAAVSVSGLIVGEAVTVTSSAGNTRTVTATAITESAPVTFATSGAGGTIIIDGLTITGDAGTTGAEFATAFATNGATLAAGMTASGSLTNYAASATSATVTTFTSLVLGANVTDLAVAGTATEAATLGTITQGNSGNLTAAQVASALATGTSSGAAVVTSAGTFGYSGVASGSTATFTASAAGVKTDMTAASTGGAQPTVSVSTQGVDAVTGSTETAEVTFTGLKSGQSVIVAGRTVTANGADLTPAQVEAAYLGGVNVNAAVVGGALAGWTVSQDGGGAGNGKLTFTSVTANSNVTNIDGGAAGTYGVSAAAAPTNAGVVVVDGNTTAGGGALTLTNMANAGTVELTAANAGTISVSMKDATGSADSLSLKLNGSSNLAAGSITVAGVETINVEATDGNPLSNPTNPATLALAASSATKLVITGNHGVDLTGSSLAKLVELDASAVTAAVSTTNKTAAQIITENGVAGAVTFTTAIGNKAVTIKTGNGDDVINATSVGTSAGYTVGATITTGAGKDSITGGADNDTIDAGSERDTVNSSTGADSITLGAGNDVYVLRSGAHSVLEKYDTITDFSANTYGQAGDGDVDELGATTVLTELTGDTINVTAVLDASVVGIKVLVVTNAADAQTFIQNTGNDATNLTGFALDSSSNLLYMDFNQDGVIDSVIKLAGVTTIDEAAFVVPDPMA